MRLVSVFLNKERNRAVVVNDSGTVSTIIKSDDGFCTKYLKSPLKVKTTAQELKAYLSGDNYWSKLWYGKKHIDKEMIDNIVDYFSMEASPISIEILDGDLEEAAVEKLKEMNPIINLSEL